MLRTILEKPELEVLKVEVQENFKNLVGRSIRLDTLCTLGNGEKCNIEVQRADNDDHLKRARYHASCITTSFSEAGTNFREIPTVYIVYLSEFDFLKEGKTIYHIRKVIEETGTVVDDGLHEIFVNTEIDDGTEIAELMQCFIKKEVDNPKFPCLSKRVQYLKSEEGGLGSMCKIMEDYAKEYLKEHEDKKIMSALEKGVDVDTICKIMDVTKEYVNLLCHSMNR